VNRVKKKKNKGTWCEGGLAVEDDVVLAVAMVESLAARVVVAIMVGARVAHGWSCWSG
jgi:hypothetical protein